ncbi:MAG TPA: hypothetical protein VIM73_09170, partial [Polyangiaceae bacterium]
MTVGRSPQALTLLLPVRDGRASALRDGLVRSRASVVRRLRDARLVAARIELVGAATEAPELLLETLFHGELSSHLRELFDCAGPELGALLSDCEGVAPTEDFSDFTEIVGRRALRSRALYYAHALPE